jgi:transcriptional regulator with XRE-family HTH domain
MRFHEKLKFFRQSKGWSQEEMAGKLAMSTNGYGSIERGETDVNLSRLYQIAKLFELDPGVLIGEAAGVIQFTGSYNSDCDNMRAISLAPSSNQTESLLHEIEKSQLINEGLAREVEHLKIEIQHLKEIISLLRGGEPIAA